MALMAFAKRANRRDVRIMIALSVLAGAANALLVLAVNQVAELVAEGARPTIWEVGLYLTAFVIYYQGNQIALIRATVIIEALLRDLRVEVIDRVRRSELPVMERLGRTSLYTMISEQTNLLSLTFPMLVETLQQAVLMVMALIYLAYLSPLALGAFLVAAAVGALIYRVLQADILSLSYKMLDRQRLFIDAMDPLLAGGKELRLSRRRDDEVFEELRVRSARLRSVLVRLGDRWTMLMLLGNAVTFAIIGFIIFYFPGNVSGYGTVVFQMVPVLLFCLGPLTRIAVQGPMFLHADAGLSAILSVKDQLAQDDAVSPEEARSAKAEFEDFKQIEINDLVYSYSEAGDADPFTVGPLKLTLNRGETVFMTGGNGSGKSTVLHLLCGLYVPSEGTISVDGKAITSPRQRGGYREIFSGVFVDFFLFDRLYGLENIDESEVNELILDMGMAGKVTFEDGKFSTLALSTGQRKRLALIVAILENRPVLVLDEWSAEQDIHFRNRFYTEIIPKLAARGQTIIAVTHDDRYWSGADRVIKLDLGWIMSDTRRTRR